MNERSPMFDWDKAFHLVMKWDAQIDDIRRDDFVDMLAGCVLPDPRIARIEALLEEEDRGLDLGTAIHAILAGGDA